MQPPVVLVAVSRRSRALTMEMLGDAFRVLPVSTVHEALELARLGKADVVLAGLHFDGSRMPMLLEAMKADPATRAIPVVCCRFLPTVLSDSVLRAARQVCDALGAAAFVDVVELRTMGGIEAAGERVRAELRRACLGVNAA
jgi:hypothetical protein